MQSVLNSEKIENSQASGLADKRTYSLMVVYCIQDILEEEDMELDWDFRLSLINDIVKEQITLESSVSTLTRIPTGSLIAMGNEGRV